MNPTFALSELTPHFTGTIQNHQGDEFYQARLIELGFTRGERVQILRRTPFGDFIVNIRTAVIALRKEEAHCLLVSND